MADDQKSIMLDLAWRIEEVLQAANRKFETRFRALEGVSRQRGLDLEGLSLAEMEAIWEEVKGG